MGCQKFRFAMKVKTMLMERSGPFAMIRFPAWSLQSNCDANITTIQSVLSHGFAVEIHGQFALVSLCCSTLTPTWIRYLQNSVVFIFVNSAVLECFYSFFEKGNSLQCDAITIMLNENISALLSNLYEHERAARRAACRVCDFRLGWYGRAATLDRRAAPRVCDFRLGWYGRVLCFSKIYTCLVRSFTQF